MASVYKPNVGGVETCIANLARFYQKMGIKTAVLTKKFPFDLPEFETVDGVSILRISRPQQLGDFINVFKIINKYKQTISGNIIHLIGIRRPMPLIGLFLSRLWQVPFIVSFAGGDLPNSDDPETIKLWQDGLTTVPKAVTQADCHIAFSNDLICLARKAIPTLNHINLIFAGVDLNRIKKSPKHKSLFPYIFIARRLTPDKGVDILIQAFSKISVKYPPLRLIIAGSGEGKDNLINLTKKLNLLNRVQFLGELTSDKVFEYMKGAIAHVCPSRAEGGGVVNLEAQAASCLSIGSNVGGIPEYIKDKKTGFIFESQNINELTGLLELAINQPDIRKKIIANASANIKNFDWKYIAQQHLKIYTKTITSTPSKTITSWNSLTKKLLVSLRLNDSRSNTPATL